MNARGSNGYVYRKKLGLKPMVQRDIFALLCLALLCVLLGREFRRANPDCESVVRCYFGPLSPVSFSRPEQVSAEENDRRLDYAYAKLELETLKKKANEPTKSNIIAYIAKTFEKEGAAVQVKAINCFYSESGLRENAVNTNKDSVQSKDHGVAQLNDYWHRLTQEEKTNFKKNIDRAYQIYKARGNFSAWYGKGCK